MNGNQIKCTTINATTADTLAPHYSSLPVFNVTLIVINSATAPVRLLLRLQFVLYVACGNHGNNVLTRTRQRVGTHRGCVGKEVVGWQCRSPMVQLPCKLIVPPPPLCDCYLRLFFQWVFSYVAVTGTSLIWIRQWVEIYRGYSLITQIDDRVCRSWVSCAYVGVFTSSFFT